MATSQINPNNINGDFPVQGQDNPSQGFRINFTNIKNNLETARSEISDLQSKAVLKSPLNGDTLVLNDFGGQTISSAVTRNFSETTKRHDSTSGDLSIGYGDGSFHTFTMSGDTKLSLQNLPNYSYARFRLLIVSDGNHYLRLPADIITWVNITNIPNAVLDTTTSPIEYKISLTAGTYLFEFSTNDSGTNIYITDVFGNRPATVKYTYANLALGNTLTVGSNINTLILDNTLGTTSANANIFLPDNTALMDGQKITITSNVAITAANVRPGSDSNIYGAPLLNTWAANSANTWVYNKTLKLWFRS